MRHPTCEKPSTPSPITVCSRAAPPSDRARSTRPPQPPRTPSGRLPVAGLPWLRKSRPHDQHLTRLTTEAAPTLLEGFGVGAHTAAQMLISFGDTPDRIRSEAACATLGGACPIPASSGMTTGRHRLYRGGHRHANAALHRTVVVRRRLRQPTVDGDARPPAGGRTRREIIRCLKRVLAREIYQRVLADFRMRRHVTQAA